MGVRRAGVRRHVRRAGKLLPEVLSQQEEEVTRPKERALSQVGLLLLLLLLVGGVIAVGRRRLAFAALLVEAAQRDVHTKSGTEGGRRAEGGQEDRAAALDSNDGRMRWAGGVHKHSRVSQEEEVEHGVVLAEVDQRPAENPAAHGQQAEPSSDQNHVAEQRPAAAALRHLGETRVSHSGHGDLSWANVP